MKPLIIVTFAIGIASVTSCGYSEADMQEKNNKIEQQLADNVQLVKQNGELEGKLTVEKVYKDAANQELQGIKEKINLQISSALGKMNLSTELKTIQNRGGINTKEVANNLYISGYLPEDSLDESGIFGFWPRTLILDNICNFNDTAFIELKKELSNPNKLWDFYSKSRSSLKIIEIFIGFKDNLHQVITAALPILDGKMDANEKKKFEDIFNRRGKEIYLPDNELKGDGEFDRYRLWLFIQRRKAEGGQPLLVTYAKIARDFNE